MFKATIMLIFLNMNILNPPPPIYSPALYLPGFLLYGGVRCINTYYDNRKLTTAQRCENLNTLFFYMHMPFFVSKCHFYKHMAFDQSLYVPK